MTWTPEALIAFEAEIAEVFNCGIIRSPVHLSGGNETQLIEYFEEHFRPGDWIFSSWRSHYHALLCGVPPERVRAAIMAGRSITLTFPEHRFLTSAIVGGTLPIALGVALGIKRDPTLWDVYRVTSTIGRLAAPLRVPGNTETEARDSVQELCALERSTIGRVEKARKPHVHCFVGDMTACTGVFMETWRYAAHHDLPLTLIVEDNGKSVLTDTKEVWGVPEGATPERPYVISNGKVYAYSYDLPWPHSGAGKRVEF